MNDWSFCLRRTFAKKRASQGLGCLKNTSFVVSSSIRPIFRYEKISCYVGPFKRYIGRMGQTECLLLHVKCEQTESNRHRI